MWNSQENVLTLSSNGVGVEIRVDLDFLSFDLYVNDIKKTSTTSVAYITRAFRESLPPTWKESCTVFFEDMRGDYFCIEGKTVKKSLTPAGISEVKYPSVEEAQKEFKALVNKSFRDVLETLYDDAYGAWE